MGWFSDLLDIGKKLIVPIGLAIATGGGSILGSIAKTVVTGIVASKVMSMVSKKSDTTKETAQDVTSAVNDAGVRLQVPPSQNQKVPVLYGQAFFGGIITEAVQSNDNTTMTYVLTLCEKTGIKISDNLESDFTFHKIFWNNNRITFQADGVTALYSQDVNGNKDSSINGLVQVYCYAGGSGASYQRAVDGTTISTSNAWDIVPNWTSAMAMNDLVFAVVKIQYSKDKNITGLPDIMFNIENSMYMPGDCLYDYMTNTRYGAAIPEEDIYVS